VIIARLTLSGVAGRLRRFPSLQGEPAYRYNTSNYEVSVMPFHNWARMPAGMYHTFHQMWSLQIMIALNSGLLPKGISAIVEPRVDRWEPDVIAVDRKRKGKSTEDDGDLLILDPPKTQMVFRTDSDVLADRANRVVVKYHLGRTIAIIELLSPGNKDSRGRLKAFVRKIGESIQKGVHVLIVDLFPPTSRDPEGIHPLIWDEIKDDTFELPADKDRTLVSYEASWDKVAYVQPIALGDSLPDMPLFLAEGKHVKVPLEATYQSAWANCPEEFREAVETGVLPQFEEDDEAE